MRSTVSKDTRSGTTGRGSPGPNRGGCSVGASARCAASTEDPRRRRRSPSSPAGIPSSARPRPCSAYAGRTRRTGRRPWRPCSASIFRTRPVAPSSDADGSYLTCARDHNGAVDPAPDVDAILDLLEESAAYDDGEPVDLLTHALQCAALLA